MSGCFFDCFELLRGLWQNYDKTCANFYLLSHKGVEVQFVHFCPIDGRVHFLVDDVAASLASLDRATAPKLSREHGKPSKSLTDETAICYELPVQKFRATSATKHKKVSRAARAHRPPVSCRHQLLPGIRDQNEKASMPPVHFAQAPSETKQDANLYRRNTSKSVFGGNTNLLRQWLLTLYPPRFNVDEVIMDMIPRLLLVTGTRRWGDEIFYSAVQFSSHLSTESTGTMEWDATAFGAPSRAVTCTIPSATGIGLRIGRSGERERLLLNEPMQEAPIKKLIDFAENRLIVSISPRPTDDQFPLVVGNVKCRPAQFRIVIQLIPKTYEKLPFVMANIAIGNRLFSRLGGVRPPTLDQLELLARESHLCDGLYLPVERRFDRDAFPCVLRLDRGLGDDRYRATLFSQHELNAPAEGETLFQRVAYPSSIEQRSLELMIANVQGSEVGSG
jgi:hypothetical protein